jgi:hypothetical protein
VSELDRLLTADPGDAGCDATFAVLELYAEALLAGDDVAARWPGVAVHLESCPACRADLDGLVAAAGEE